MEEEIKLIFKGEKYATVTVYREFLNTLATNAEREEFLTRTFELAFTGWKALPLKYQKFLVALIKSEREAFLRYTEEQTVLGQLRYTLKDPKGLILMIHLLEHLAHEPMPPVRGSGEPLEPTNSWTALAFSTKLAFNYPNTLYSLRKMLRKAKGDVDYFLSLIGLIEME